MAGYREQDVIIEPINKRLPDYSGQSGGGGGVVSMGGGTSPGTDITGLENTFTQQNTFKAETYFQDKINIGNANGVYGYFLGDETNNRVNAYGNFYFDDEPTFNADINANGGITIDSLKSLTFSNAIAANKLTVRDGGNGMGVGSDFYIDGDLHTQGTIYSYSQDEIKVGDSWFYLGVAEATAQDGGLIISNENNDVIGKLFYDVSFSEWNTNSDDLNLHGGALITSHADANNIDHIYHDDTNNEWNFVSDGSYKQTANSKLRAANYYTNSYGNSMNWYDGYQHSQVTTGNPHGIDLADIGESYATINYWTKTGNNLSYAAGTVTVNNSLYANGTFGKENSSPGLTGTGWGIDSDGNLYVKSLEVRTDFTVFSITYEKLEVNEGSQLYTEGIKVLKISGSAIYYQDRGYNVFNAGDIVRCQEWAGGTSLKYYQIDVTTVGLSDTYKDSEGNYMRYITYTSKDGTGTIAESDTIVRVSGDVMEITSRDGAYLQIANGITTVSGSWTTQLRYGYINGLSSTAKGSAATGYGIFSEYFVVDSSGAYFSGHISADSGDIGGFTINSSKLYSGALIGSGAGLALDSTNKSFMAYKDSNNYVSVYYTSSTNWGLKAVGGGTTYFSFVNGALYAKDAEFENCNITGRFTTDLTEQRVDLDDTVVLDPDSNDYRFTSATASSFYLKLRVDAPLNKPKDGQVFTFVSGGSYASNIGIYCDDSSVNIRKKSNGNLANSTTNAIWLYSYKADSGAADYVVQFKYISDGNYLVQI